VPDFLEEDAPAEVAAAAGPAATGTSDPVAAIVGGLTGERFVETSGVGLPDLERFEREGPSGEATPPAPDTTPDFAEGDEAERVDVLLPTASPPGVDEQVLRVLVRGGAMVKWAI
jgi:hypothetical protein